MRWRPQVRGVRLSSAAFLRKFASRTGVRIYRRAGMAVFGTLWARWCAIPKRWRTTAVQDAGATAHAAGNFREVVDCGRPLPLFFGKLRAGPVFEFFCGWVSKFLERCGRGGAQFQSGGGQPQSKTLARLLTRRVVAARLGSVAVIFRNDERRGIEKYVAPVALSQHSET